MGHPLPIHYDKAELQAFCRKWGVTRLAFFGSVLRDDFRPESDIDVLIELAPGARRGLAFMQMEEELSAILQGRRVDVVNVHHLNPRLKDGILREMEVQFAQG